MFHCAKKTTGPDVPGVVSARLGSDVAARGVTFVWSPRELGITAVFAKNWPQRRIIVFVELLSQRRRYRRAASLQSQIRYSMQGRLEHHAAHTHLSPLVREGEERCSNRLHSSATDFGHVLVVGSIPRRRAGPTSWAGMTRRFADTRHAHTQGARRSTALWERYESWSSGSNASRGELPDAFGMRAARPSQSALAPGGQAGLDAYGCGRGTQAACREWQCRRAVVGEFGQPEGTREPQRPGGASAADRAGRRRSPREIRCANNGGRASTRQDMAISKGRMHREPFTVSGCPDQEIRNADL